MIGPFAVGEYPTQPVVLDVQLSGYDLTEYDTITVEAPGLPDGQTVVIDADTVAYLFSGPFTTPGVFPVRVRGQLGEHVDISSYIHIRVYPTPLVASGEAAIITGAEPPSIEDLVLAQSLVSLRIDQDLSDADWLATLSASDLRRVRAAVAYTAADTEFLHTTDTRGEIQSQKSGSTSVTYRAGTSSARTSLTVLPALAELMIGKLSWRKRPKQLMPTLPGEYYVDDPFATQPIVRPPLPDEAYWHPADGWI